MRVDETALGQFSNSFWAEEKKSFPIPCELWFTKEHWKLKALLIYHVKQRVIFLPLLCFHIIMLTACMGGIKEFLNKNNNFLLSTFIIHISKRPAGWWCLLPVKLNLFCTPLICLAQLRGPLMQYLQDNAPVGVLQQINHIRVRQPIQRLPIDADNPVSNLEAQKW